MKIVATVTDVGSVVFAGGNPESKSAIIDIGDNLPKIVREYLRESAKSKEIENYHCYKTLSFSLLEEDENE